MLMDVLLFAAGLGLLVLGANVLVRGASNLALSFGISPLVVGLTVVAFGTSAPEIAVSVGAVLGGIGSLPGAMLGGLLIGLIETFWSAYFSIEYKDVAAFSILVLVLIFLPTGLLGKPEIEKV